MAANLLLEKEDSAGLAILYKLAGSCSFSRIGLAKVRFLYGFFMLHHY
jgi:hypothetical protein